MRFDDVARRLASLPDPLPPAPDTLLPVLVTGGARIGGDQTGRALRPAAVLVLLHPDETGEARVVLTERTAYEGYHSGEVSFPGGKAEPGDADLVATALREAAEEIGLDPDAVGLAVVGRLEPVRVAVSGHVITPVLALARRAPFLAAHPGEVARVLVVPIDAFLPGAPMPVVQRRIGGWELRYAVYPVEGLEIWGATARILGQLGAVLAGG